MRKQASWRSRAMFWPSLWLPDQRPCGAVTTELGPPKHLASPDNHAAAASEQSCNQSWLGDQLLSGLGSGARASEVRVCLLRTALSFTMFCIRTFIALVYFLLIADCNIIFSTTSGCMHLGLTVEAVYCNLLTRCIWHPFI